MENSHMAPRGMIVTPHHLASQSALAILREGGTAMEAMIAAAATIAVVYPHMNSIGGDGFWLIVPPHDDPLVIEACGAAGSLATPDFFAGYDKIPSRGPKAAITVAGTIGGWQEVMNYVSECGYQQISTSRLLADAIYYAEHGFPVSRSLKTSINNVKSNGNYSLEFGRIFLPEDKIPEVGDKIYQKSLSKTLRHLADNGLSSFYRGDLSKMIAKDMERLGMPVTESDLVNYTAVRKIPLRLQHSHGELFNVPLPTQGVISLSILGMLDNLGIDGKNEGEFIHAAIEATKLGFRLRDQYVTDPSYMKIDAQSLLSDTSILRMANQINLDKVSSGKGEGPGDTIWMGIMDNKGFSVSFIQSVYHEFGSGLILPRTGIIWQNRGVSFSLDKDHIRAIKPGKKPFHTLNPAAARLNDGRVMIYGTRGGDGQPQTQTAIFHRYVVQRKNLQASISAPRWLFGDLHGEENNTVKLENRFSQDTVNYLKDKGHEIIMWPAFTEKMGQAGALVRHRNGMLEGAYDPRSDGSADGF